MQLWRHWMPLHFMQSAWEQALWFAVKDLLISIHDAHTDVRRISHAATWLTHWMPLHLMQGAWKQARWSAVYHMSLHKSLGPGKNDPSERTYVLYKQWTQNKSLITWQAYSHTTDQFWIDSPNAWLVKCSDDGCNISYEHTVLTTVLATNILLYQTPRLTRVPGILPGDWLRAIIVTTSLQPLATVPTMAFCPFCCTKWRLQDALAVMFIYMIEEKTSARAGWSRPHDQI